MNFFAQFFCIALFACSSFSSHATTKLDWLPVIVYGMLDPVLPGPIKVNMVLDPQDELSDNTFTISWAAFGEEGYLYKLER